MNAIIPASHKKSKLKNIPIDFWTRSVTVFIENNGDAPLAYRKLKAEGIDYGYSRFISFIHNGDDVRNLPPIQQIYNSHLQKAVQKTRVSMAKRLEATLQITEDYKEAIAGKVALLKADPRQVTRNLGAEIRHINEVELGISKVLGEDEDRLKRENMSIDEARKRRDEAVAHLASKAAKDDEDEDYGLSNVLVLKKR